MTAQTSEKLWYIRERRKWLKGVNALHKEFSTNINIYNGYLKTFKRNNRIIKNAKENIDTLQKYITICKLLKSVKYFVTMSKDNEGMISYSTKADFRYSHKNRIRTTLRKFINRNYQTIPNTELDFIEDKLSLHLPIKQITFSEFRGNDIVECYKHAVGGRSCMTNNSSVKTQFYADNPEKICLLVGTPHVAKSAEGAASASNSSRCLIWQLDSGEIYGDRIYTRGTYNETFVAGKVKEYLIKKYPKTKIVTYYDKRHRRKHLSATLKPSTNGKYPYADTFLVGCRTENSITVYDDEFVDQSIEINTYLDNN